MKIRPVILCGGSGTRLWPNQKKHQAKQFINFGNWTLFGKTLDRVKNSLFDSPIISTNKKYLNEVKKHLKEKKIKKFKIILEPIKKNTASAIISSALIKDIPDNQLSNWSVGMPYLRNKTSKVMLSKLTNANLISRSKIHKQISLNAVNNLNLIYLYWSNRFQDEKNDYFLKISIISFSKKKERIKLKLQIVPTFLITFL